MNKWGKSNMISNLFTKQYAVATGMIMLHIDVWLTLVQQNHFRLNYRTIKVQCLASPMSQKQNMIHKAKKRKEKTFMN